MTNTTLIASVTGIVVSGVVGPTATTWAARRAARKQFNRDQAARRRDERAVLLDEAASLLGLGPTRLREMRETPQSDTERWKELRAWAEEVFTMGQRLRLRLGAASAVVVTYELVRKRLIETQKIKDEPDQEEALTRYESARDDWLVAAKADLDAELSEDEPSS